MEKYIDSTGTPRNGETQICNNCNKEYVTRHVKKDRIQKYCSRPCVLEAKNKNNKFECECAFCKTKILKLKSKLGVSKSGLYFCNRTCKESGQKLGGIKEIMPHHYGTGISRLKKEVVFKRFNIPLLCCDCKENKEYLLCVHHIDGNSKNNIKENLEIVCYNCHIKRHLELFENKWQFNSKKLTPRDKLGEL